MSYYDEDGHAWLAIQHAQERYEDGLDQPYHGVEITLDTSQALTRLGSVRARLNAGPAGDDRPHTS